MKIEPVACISMLGCAMKFKLPEMEKNDFFLLFMPHLRELVLFHPYFVCKCSIREI